MNLSRFCAPISNQVGGVAKVASGCLLLLSFLGNMQPGLAAQSLYKLNNRFISSPAKLEFTKHLPDPPPEKPELKGKVNVYANSELQELESYAKRFKKRLDIESGDTQTHWTSVPFRHKFWLYTIDKEKFLGNCSVAKLGHDVDTETHPELKPNFSYYLVLMHFNIPAVKATTIPLKYGFARFEAKIACGTSEVTAIEDKQKDNFSRFIGETLTKWKLRKVPKFFLSIPKMQFFQSTGKTQLLSL